MNLFSTAAALAAFSIALAGGVSAAENPLMGKWIDKLPSGASMIIEFTPTQISFQNLTEDGAFLPASIFPITYRSEGKDQYVIAIEGQPSDPMAVMLTAPNKLSLKFPGRDARDLDRYVAANPEPARPRGHP